MFVIAKWIAVMFLPRFRIRSLYDLANALR